MTKQQKRAKRLKSKFSIYDVDELSYIVHKAPLCTSHVI